VVGRGGAEKEQVQRMVQMILGVRDSIAPDAADALAAAICHAHERATRELLRTAAVKL
jgi:crossover junction endodeoxyribonuclease RuvC